ncbi:metal ABC transporter substrate-binding protein [Craurococcus roseus]|uniref:Metal ABC transporter substrate-binding protein n=1 Tax=Craurococcus roseus TaxID=77585 RepID=A0ABN1EK29_9PROT
MSPDLPRRAVLVAAALAAPSGPRAQERARLPVVASFSILGDMVRQIAGDGVALRVLAGPDTDAHAFQPRPSDAEAVRGAAVVVRNGLGFEPWLDRLLRSAGHRGVVVTASDGVAPVQASSGHGHGHGATDPHAWQDVGRARAYVARIGEGLADADPPRAAAWREAAAAYDSRLETLDRHVRERIAEVPQERRVVVTSHDAFGYFGAAYGVRFLAPQGIATGSQPSAAQVAALLRQIRAERVTAVFIDGPGSQAVMERLAREAGVRPRGRLYADTLSAPDGPAPTYEAMQRHNVGLLVAGMRGGAV